MALKVRVLLWSTLLHQNSSSAWPLAETAKTARLALRGKLMVLVALSAGSVNWLTPLVALLRAEMG